MENVKLVIDDMLTNQLTPIRVTTPDMTLMPENLAAWYAVDPYRPQYHFSAAQNWINDPNGLIQWKGHYHLFYQHHPYSPAWGPMHWGHAISTNLIHWQHLPIAMYPEETAQAAEDKSGIFSGSAVDDNGTLTLLYTNFTDLTFHPDAIAETQALATSTDGVNFVKYAGNPVIARPPARASAGFRDPKVWQDTDGLWKMVLGSGDGGKGNVHLYRSPDLRQWTYLGVLFEGDGTTGKMWECPDLFPVGDQYVLIVSINEEKFQGVRYFAGAYRDNQFFPEKNGLLDVGPDFYAPQSCLDDQGRRIVIGWMERWGGAMPTQAGNWAGAMSLPREVFVRPDGTVATRPVAEVRSLRKTIAPLYHVDKLTGTPDMPNILAQITGDTLEIGATIRIPDPQMTAFELAMRQAPDGSEKLVLQYQGQDQALTLDRNSAGIGDRGTYSAPLALSSDNTIELHLYLDRSSLEVFANDGQLAATTRFYPHWQESLGLALTSTGGSIMVQSLDIWELRSIWE